MSQPTLGLDEAGFIVREVNVANVQAAYRPVVARLVERCRADLGADFHSLYLYGSIVMGTAEPGRSDLDALVLLAAEPNAEHRDLARSLADSLVAEFPFVTKADILVHAAREILDPSQRYDMGFFVKCLCACVASEDLAPRLPDYRPSRELAAGTNGNVGDLIAVAQGRLTQTDDPAAVRAICRGIMRKIVRTGFTLVMPEEGCWTNSLDESCRLFGKHYPEKRDAMEAVLQLALMPIDDPTRIDGILNTFGAWLTDEYAIRVLEHVSPQHAGSPARWVIGR